MNQYRLKTEPMKTWIKIVLAIVLIGIIAALLGYFFIYNKPHKDYEKAKPAFTLPAKELYDAFVSRKDESSAKYNDQVILLSGRVSKIEATDSLVIAVFVFNQGMFGDEGIRCTFLPKYNETARKILPDSEIRVKGYCAGFTDTDVILEQCSLPE